MLKKIYKELGAYIGGVFVSIDQLGNTLAGGNPDVTISARVGYFAGHRESTKGDWNWKAFERIIDLTFWPVDGKGHCHQAYHADAGEDYYPQGYKVLYLLAAGFILLTCPVIATILYTRFLFVGKPKPYNALENIQSRTAATQREIWGMREQISEIGSVDAETLEKLDFMLKEAHKLVSLARGNVTT